MRQSRRRGFSTIPGQLSETVSAASWTAGSRFISCPHLLWNRRPPSHHPGVARITTGKVSRGWEQCYRMQMSLISHLLSGRRLPLSTSLRADLSALPPIGATGGTTTTSSFSHHLFPVPISISHRSFIRRRACLTATFLSICLLLCLLVPTSTLRDSLSPDRRTDLIVYRLAFDRLGGTGKGVSA